MSEPSPSLPPRSPSHFLPYEAFEHTADLAYIARGRTLGELFENAAAGMMHFLIDLSSVRPVKEVSIEIEAEDTEELLVSWLQEILYHEEVRLLILSQFRVEEISPRRLRASVLGEPYDAARHSLLTDIKAATYHDLRIEQEETDGGQVYRVRIVLDI